MWHGRLAQYYCPESSSYFHMYHYVVKNGTQIFGQALDSSGLVTIPYHTVHLLSWERVTSYCCNITSAIRPGRFVSSQHQRKTTFPHCQKILIQALVYTGLQELASRFVFVLHLELFTVFVSLVFVIWQSLRGTV